MPIPVALVPTLDRIVDPLVDRSLAAALPVAEPDTQAEIVERLLDRGEPRALEDAIAAYSDLQEAAQARLRDALPRMARSMRAVLQRADPTAGLRVIAEAGDPAMADLLARPLRRREPGVAERSAGVLLDLTIAVVDRPEPAPARVLRGLDETIDAAVADFSTHRQPASLLALFARLPARLRGWADLGRPTNSALEPARRLLEQADHPAARRALLAALAEPHLAAAARTGLHACLRRGRLRDVLHPLVGPAALADPAVRRRLASAETLREAARDAVADAFADEALDPCVATLFALLLPAVDGPPASDWHRHPRLAHRARALIATTRRPWVDGSASFRAEDDPLTAAAMRDPDEAVARLAARAALRRHRDRVCDVATRWLNGPHPSVRRLAQARVAPQGFDWLWERWPRLPEAARRDTATALIKIDRRLHHRLAARLDQPDEAVRCRALRIIHDLNQGVFFQDRLTQLAESSSPAIASAAIRALGTAESPESAHALRDALAHPDARIRANAVEAIARRGLSDATPAVARVAREDDTEPRAQAIAALHQTHPDSAVDALHAMLADDRSAHRDRALWLIESMGLVEMARQVAEMSISDPSPAVRQRATDVVGELMRLLGGEAADAPDAATSTDSQEAA